jgi:hypothetical protein
LFFTSRRVLRNLDRGPEMPCHFQTRSGGKKLLFFVTIQDP